MNPQKNLSNEINTFLGAVADEKDYQLDPQKEKREEDQLREKGFYLKTTYNQGMVNHEIVKASEYLTRKNAKEKELKNQRSFFSDPDLLLQH